MFMRHINTILFYMIISSIIFKRMCTTKKMTFLLYAVSAINPFREYCKSISWDFLHNLLRIFCYCKTFIRICIYLSHILFQACVDAEYSKRSILCLHTTLVIRITYSKLRKVQKCILRNHYEIINLATRTINPIVMNNTHRFSFSRPHSMALFLILFFLLGGSPFDKTSIITTEGHGRLIEPPSRSTMWR